MKVERVLPTSEATELLDLVEDIARDSLAPRAALAERDSNFPRDAFTMLGASGLLGLPYPEEYGGAAQPYEVYLQVIEELSRAWLTVGLGISVHTLSCFPLARFGTDAQRARWLPDMLGGALLGAYCLSEPDSGSDAGALRTRATRVGDNFQLDGTKAWITHAGQADFYTVMARTSDERSRGISCFLIAGESPGLRAGPPEHKMGLQGSPTGQLHLSDVDVDADRLIGAEGQGFTIALAALDTGRLGIAACAVGLAQAALDVALDYAGQRRQFGHSIADFEGVGFLLADMATGIEAARAMYLAAARRASEGMNFTRQAAMAKLFCTDMAMRVTTDAVQVLGGYGYVEDYPVERYMREAKALQIVEGTNQVQRLVISRQLRKE
ncbi:MAG TPA: acyl-CoA dehydrogenase family protein [Acidothermaceae bacterium]|jgi:alkylation response protein AidB-like acyl-CoA dehydrogenase